jgi:hypothetical protein
MIYRKIVHSNPQSLALVEGRAMRGATLRESVPGAGLALQRSCIAGLDRANNGAK